MAVRIDGKALAAKVKARVAEGAAQLPRKAGLAVILVGDDPASRVYVSGKEKDCTECGIQSFEHKLPAEIALDLDIMVVIFPYGFNENIRRIYQNVRKTHKREVSV